MRKSVYRSFIRFRKANNKPDPHLQFGLLTDVTELELSNNEFTGTLPSEIFAMTKIETGGGNGLVRASDLTGTVPTEIGRVTKMTYFMVSWGSTRKSNPKEVAQHDVSLLSFVPTHADGVSPLPLHSMISRG